MDNQQVKTLYDIGWIVGFIEGEGCLTLIRTKGYKSNKISPYISITGTNAVSMQRAIDIAHALDLPFYVRESHYSSNNPKKAIRIIVEGLSRTSKWLDIIHEYMTGKRAQADILRRYIDRRNKIIKLHPANKPYTDEDIDDYHQIHDLNQGHNRPKVKTPETTRRPWQQVKV